MNDIGTYGAQEENGEGQVLPLEVRVRLAGTRFLLVLLI